MSLDGLRLASGGTAGDTFRSPGPGRGRWSARFFRAADWTMIRGSGRDLSIGSVLVGHLVVDQTPGGNAVTIVERGRGDESVSTAEVFSWSELPDLLAAEDLFDGLDTGFSPPDSSDRELVARDEDDDFDDEDEEDEEDEEDDDEEFDDEESDEDEEEEDDEEEWEEVEDDEEDDEEDESEEDEDDFEEEDEDWEDDDDEDEDEDEDEDDWEEDDDD